MKVYLAEFNHSINSTKSILGIFDSFEKAFQECESHLICMYPKMEFPKYYACMESSEKTIIFCTGSFAYSIHEYEVK